MPTRFAALQRRWSRLKGKAWRSYVKRQHVAALLAAVPRDADILEIGGGYHPRYVKATHPNVRHLDHAPTEVLRAKYAAFPSMRPFLDRIPPIDFVSDGRPLEQLVPPALRFDLIYGSHVLEHQVDLIGHLQSLERLLKPGGCIIEMIPDLRTTFDALRFPSVTSDALLAHIRPAPVHRGKQVFDGLAREIDLNNGYRLCNAELEDARFTRDLRAAHAAMLAAEVSGQPYTDLHAWAFTPESFRLLMIELRLLGLTRLEPSFVSPQYGNQFCAVLKPSVEHDDGLGAAERTALERERLELSKSLRLV